MTIFFLPLTIVTLPLAWPHFSSQVWSISVFNWAHHKAVWVPGEHIKVRIFLIVRVFNSWPSLPEGDGESLPKGSYFPNLHTSSSTISWVCRMGQEERRSMGYYQGGLTFSLLERHQVWVFPLSSVMLHQGKCLELLWTVLNNILHSHVLAVRRRRGKKLSICMTWILQAMGSDPSGNSTWKQRLIPNALFVLSCGNYLLSP